MLLHQWGATRPPAVEDGAMLWKSAALGEHGGFGCSGLSPGRGGGQLGEARVYLPTGSFAPLPTPPQNEACVAVPRLGEGWEGGPPRLPGPRRPLPSPQAAPGRGGWLWSSGMGVSGLFWVWPEITHRVTPPRSIYIQETSASIDYVKKEIKKKKKNHPSQK